MALTFMRVKKKSKSALHEGEQLDRSKRTSSVRHGASLNGDTNSSVTASGMPKVQEIDLEIHFEWFEMLKEDDYWSTKWPR